MSDAFVSPEKICIKAPLPGFIEPALASKVERVPEGSRWIHEIKFDGYRVQIHIANNDVKIYTRRGHDWTKRLRKIAEDAWHVKAGSAIIDGEVVVPSADGTTDFAVLQNELKGRSTRIVLVAFDLLYLNGQDLRRLPLTARKAQLKKIVAGSDIQFSDSFTIAGREVFEHACKLGLEGVVSKVADSPYASGRSRDWVKVTCAQRETLPKQGLHSMARNGMDFMSAVRRAKTLSTRAKSTMGSTKPRRPSLTPLIRKTQPYAKRMLAGRTFTLLISGRKGSVR